MEYRVLVPNGTTGETATLARQAAGIVLCGGPDIAPARYGEDARPDIELSLYPELDELEHQVLLGARAGNTPIWAICRGLQALNVFFGGSLWQDIDDPYKSSVQHAVAEPLDFPAHKLKVTNTQESFGKLLDKESVAVNSRHHQAIKTLSPDLLKVAEAPDGLIEVAVSARSDWWTKGVQWHPENLMADDLQRQLWLEFIQAARDNEKRSSAI
jgi:putative glutamine amidotransferase